MQRNNNFEIPPGYTSEQFQEPSEPKSYHNMHVNLKSIRKSQTKSIVQAFKGHISHNQRIESGSNSHTGSNNSKSNLTCKEKARISVHRITNKSSSKSEVNVPNRKQKHNTN